MKRGGPIPRRTPLRAVSAKRAREQRTYAKLRVAFLAGQRCGWPGGCVRAASEVHHKRGRVGALYLDTTHWLAACHEHHAFLTNHPQIAYDMGLSERRVGVA